MYSVAASTNDMGKDLHIDKDLLLEENGGIVEPQVKGKDSQLSKHNLNKLSTGNEMMLGYKRLCSQKSCTLEEETKFELEVGGGKDSSIK
jgi:hypothetical protein